MNESLTSILQIITSVVCVGIIPWMITVERRLSTLIALGKNGLTKTVEGLQKDYRQQQDKLQKLELKIARYEGGQASDSAIIS